ncbi:hypothetical protein FHX74_002544 [Friedmanniella endophytica]|uniref:Glycosyl hydrolase family 65, N-terminal domain n=1 Tax=Microlunatus kandeliicorticis TaxID=1759536 RepID=A0A7W3ITF8_9ACTN|nr:hypothetical protein [Microlunatus kandeliicorticis]MBA8794916.1 hypothetical protein [Microlunatus kandeliicorticis]
MTRGDRGRPWLFAPDVAALVGRSDLEHRGTVGRGPEGFPVGSGRLGGPVWQSDERTLSLQLNHTDAFMFGDASAASSDHPNAGGGALGRVHVDLGGPVFGPDTTQRLALHRGTLTVDGAGVHVEVSGDPVGDRVMIMVRDERAEPAPVTVALTLVREADQHWGEHRASSVLRTLGRSAVLEQSITEPADSAVAGNDFAVSTVLSVSVPDRVVTAVTPGRVGERDCLRLELPAASGTTMIMINGAAVVGSDTGACRAVLAGIGAPVDPAAVREAALAWWEDFWDRSFVYLPDRPDYEQRRTYFLYLSAIANGGAFPGKYNGGLWIGEEDRRDWGSFYWNWNQDPLYQPLAAADQLELLFPLIRMRYAALPRYRAAARQLWGADGLFIGETVGVLGWEVLADDVADELRDYYGFRRPVPGPALREQTARRNRFLVPWNWYVDGVERPAGYVTHTLVATQETAEHLWTVYGHTLDLDWLREVAYPFIAGAAELYRTFPGLRREDDGLFHVTGTNLHEHIWGGRDVIDDLALARGTFGVAVAAAELLDLDAELREQWALIRDHLAPYPRRTDPGALWAATTNPTLADRLASPEPAWAQGLEPAVFVRDLHGTESPVLKMIEKYDVLTLETRDQGLDGGDWAIAQNTFRHAPGYLNQVSGDEVDRNGSSRFHVDAARLGRADDLDRILATQYGVFSTYGEQPNLLFDQGDYYSIEGFGTFVTAVQEALQQSLAPRPGGDPVVRVFPAWPRDHDVRYRLLARGGFLVASAMTGGRIGYVEVESRLGGLLRVRKPWAEPTQVQRDGVPAERLDGPENALLTLDTDSGERLVLVRVGESPDDHRSSTVVPTRRP